YAILAKKLSPQLHVHAVEPLESFRDFFAENILLNDLSESDFVIHPSAVGAMNGRVSFLQKGYESQLLVSKKGQGLSNVLAMKLKNIIKTTLGTFGVKRYAAGSGTKSEIDTVTMATLMQQVGRVVDVMSMDVQGLESDILSGGAAVMERGDVKTFIIGTHGRVIHQQCISMLTNKDYSIEYEEENTQQQPDGIIVASKGVRRLSA
ncbi:MAG: FkbM family methyltransferase, partial [Gammaproteobacteria bacterium]|nr:FkbM family methyltransferase [Gammaproteobacteria bacterium]